MLFLLRFTFYVDFGYFLNFCYYHAHVNLHVLDMDHVGRNTNVIPSMERNVAEGRLGRSRRGRGCRMEVHQADPRLEP